MKGENVKYKTVIEVYCDARNEDEAMYTAGEFLRGNVQPGVEMSSRTKKVFSLSSIREKVAAFI